MGYWTKNDLPFTYSLASTFPIADRWFCSVLGQTDPNRRYLIAATSAGMTDDVSTMPAIGVAAQNALLAQRGNGTIFERLTDFGISWTNYTASYPLGATPELFPANDTSLESGAQRRPFNRFFADAATGSLPAFSFLDEDYDTQSQENPQNIVVGEAMLARSCMPWATAQAGESPCSFSPTTSMAATTTTCRHRWRSLPTRCLRWSRRGEHV